MAEPGLSLTVEELRNQLCFYMGHGLSYSTGPTDDQKTMVDFVIKRGLRQFYTPPPLKEAPSGHNWSFLRKTAEMQTTAPYTTGPVSGVTAGVVTFSGGADLPTWTQDGELTYLGTTYTIASRNSSTELTLDDTSVTDATADRNYSLERQLYDLPDDFGGIRGDLTYLPNITSLTIRVVDESATLVARQRNGSNTGKPEVVSVVVKDGSYDSSTPDFPTRFQLKFTPTPDGILTIKYQYDINPDGPISGDDDNDELYGGLKHGETILASCLAVAEQYQAQPGLTGFGSIFIVRLAASIVLDRKAIAPEYFGLNGDMSDIHTGLSRRSDINVTYDDVLY